MATEAAVGTVLSPSGSRPSRRGWVGLPSLSIGQGLGTHRHVAHPIPLPPHPFPPLSPPPLSHPRASPLSLWQLGVAGVLIG